MNSRIGDPITFAFGYKSGGLRKTGLTPTVDVFNPADAKIVAAAAATETPLSGGYKYTLSGSLTATAGVYLAVSTTSDVTVDERDMYSLWIVGKDWVQDILALVATLGSAGAGLTGIPFPSESDPLASAVPGSYGAGTAGFIIGGGADFDGTATAGGASTISLQAGTGDVLWRTIVLVGGTGKFQSRTIVGQAALVATVDTPWAIPPDATTKYTFGPTVRGIVLNDPIANISLETGTILASPAPTPTAFSAGGLTGTTGAYNGMQVLFQTPGKPDIKRSIRTHTVVSGRHDFVLDAAPSSPLPSAPSTGDTFLVA